MDNTKYVPDRARWVAALSALPYSTLRETVDSLTADYDIRHKSVPNAGLGMLKLRESALQEPYNLGEFPIATAWVEITTPQGTAEGAAHVMDDSVDMAITLAISDAILAHRLSGWEVLATLLEQGEAINAAKRKERNTILAKTHVDFSLLDASGSMGSE